MKHKPQICRNCGGHNFTFSRYCGVWVCSNSECNWHAGLVRCYCGWAADGGDGKRQLKEMGETIDED